MNKHQLPTDRQLAQHSRQHPTEEDLSLTKLLGSDLAVAVCWSAVGLRVAAVSSRGVARPNALGFGRGWVGLKARRSPWAFQLPGRTPGSEGGRE